MALAAGHKPEIFHSDHGCQLTSTALGRRLKAEEIKINRYSRRRCYDNILAERLWRTLKYEEVHLFTYSDGWKSRHACHSSFGGVAMQGPIAAWEAELPMKSIQIDNPAPLIRN